MVPEPEQLWCLCVAVSAFISCARLDCQLPCVASAAAKSCNHKPLSLVDTPCLLHEIFYVSRALPPQQLASAPGHAHEAGDEEDQELDLDDPDLLDDEVDSDENPDDADDLDAEDDPDQNQEDPEDDGMGIFRQGVDQSSHPTAAAAAPGSGLLDEGPSADVDTTAGMSKHERQQLRMQERIARLEAQNMAEKDWFMQGEADAGRPPPHPPLHCSPTPRVPNCLAHRHDLVFEQAQRFL